MAVLQILKGVNSGHQYPLEAERAILGRHPDCDVVLEVGAVSRQHAQIVCENEQYFVEDLNSRNGTYLNGRMLEGRALLKDNDRVKICDMLFTFHHEPPGPLDETTPLPEDDAAEQEVPGVTVEEDEDGAHVTSTIMSTIKMSDGGGLRVGVRPEAKLRALIDLYANLSDAIKLDEVLNKILESLFKIFPQADRGFVLLRGDGEALIPKAVRHRRADSDEQVRVSKTIINQVLTQKESILSADASHDARFNMAESITDFRIRSMMCVPMFDKEGKPVGVLQLDTQDQNQKFEQEDLELLASVGSQAAFMVENAKLHETLLKKRSEEKDMEFANQVQRGFLPDAPPTISGYSFYDFYQPARKVGGDYFDYIPLPDNKLAIVLGDVAGKGVSAALLMAKLSSEVRYCLVS
ncbi:MAG: FHA domain-containing protein, partial [Planctomycetales bacterium]